MTQTGLNPALAAKVDSDFAEMDKRIRAALLKLEASPRLKASQKVLSELSNCSRGTINNRKWAISELKSIKSARVSSKKNSLTQPFEDKRDVDSVQQLKQQLNDSRDEVIVWKNKHDALLELYEAQQHILQVLSKKSQTHLSKADSTQQPNPRSPVVNIASASSKRRPS